MRDHDLLKPAVEPTLAVLRAIRPDQLDLPTPCADFTVRGLLDHMHEWAPILGAAGGGSAAPAGGGSAVSAGGGSAVSAGGGSAVSAGGGSAVSAGGAASAGGAGSVGGGSVAELSFVADELAWLADVWSQPAAWEGTTTMGGGDPLPAALVGGMAFGEIVVHGWDLARATGQSPEWDDDVVALLFREVERTAELGRQVKAYGPEVPVPATAPLLDRALGLTGRDPYWTPPTP